MYAVQRRDGVTVEEKENSCASIMISETMLPDDDGA